MSAMSQSAKRDEENQRTLILDQFTPYRIAVLSHAISGQLANAYASENITIPEWRVLAGVAQAKALAARDVVRMTPMDKMTVSRAVASLEDKGLVERTASVSDKRVSMLFLSKAGRALFERIAEMALDFEDSLLSGLSQQERNAFNATVQKLEQRANDLTRQRDF